MNFFVFRHIFLSFGIFLHQTDYTTSDCTRDALAPYQVRDFFGQRCFWAKKVRSKYGWDTVMSGHEQHNDSFTMLNRGCFPLRLKVPPTTTELVFHYDW